MKPHHHHLLAAHTAAIAIANSGSAQAQNNYDWNGGGTYFLLDGTASVDTANLNNLGLASAYVMGDTGKQAYFGTGSLNLVVIPEPRAAQLGGLGLLALLRRRRRV